MIDLSTDWLGLRLRSPLVVGASPLSDDVAALRRAVDAGAGAVIMRSLFEEQIVAEQLAAHRFIDARVDMDAEARGFLPGAEAFGMGSEPYLRQLGKLREALDVPVLGSLNGTTPGGWVELARDIERAGAAGLELNLYEVVTSFERSSADVEARQLEVVESVAKSVSIPVQVKLSPFYASLPSFVRRLEGAGARGVAVFNRFYQPDVDLESLDVSRMVHLSTPGELPLRLHALALLSGRVGLSLACTGGVHTGDDAAKAILTGADVVMVVSALLRDGPERMAGIRAELEARMALIGYHGVGEARGVLSLDKVPDPHAWERIQYVKMLQGWQPPIGRRAPR
jgi:dihydroorotate dehydrogenase (fumarate)